MFHPFSIFPELLTFTFFAPLLLRVAVGTLFFWMGYKHLTKERRTAEESVLHGRKWGPLSSVFIWSLGTVEILAGGALFIGLYAQVAALAGVLLSALHIKLHRCYSTFSPYPKTYYLLLAVICLSLILTGAGAFAFDLPL